MFPAGFRSLFYVVVVVTLRISPPPPPQIGRMVYRGSESERQVWGEAHHQTRRRKRSRSSFVFFFLDSTSPTTWRNLFASLDLDCIFTC